MLEVDGWVFRAMLDWLSEEIEAGQESEASPSCADLEDAELHIIAAQSATNMEIQEERETTNDEEGKEAAEPNWCLVV